MRHAGRLFLVLLLVVAPSAARAQSRETATVTLLATTDLHGFLYPYDYFTRQPASRGLAAAATLVEEVRRETPNTLLVDCGDTIQGSSLESVHQAAVKAGTTNAPDPMMLAMNALGYDAMVVGNHEFNFGLGEPGGGTEGRALPLALRQHPLRGGGAGVRAVRREDRGRREGRGRRDHDLGHPGVGEAGEHPRPLFRRTRGGGAPGASRALGARGRTS